MYKILHIYSKKRIICIYYIKEVIFLFENKILGNTVKNEDGYVWILEGKVFVKDPIGKGIPPALNPCEGVKLTVNGVETRHLVMVSEKDTIEVEAIHEEKEMEIDIEISPDNLKAYMSFKPRRTVKRYLKDSYPMNKLDICVYEEEIYKKSDVNELLNIIKEQGIVYGIKEDLIREICENNKKGRFLIAEGKAPIDATDDTLECLLTISDKKDIGENENIDYKNLITYISVKPGDKIARLIRGFRGEEGISVLGVPIEPKEARRIIIESNSNIQFDEETNLIIAKKHGTPEKKENGNVITYDIREQLKLNEVSLKTGNINFKGDVEVIGSVHEDMEVISTNNITVLGDVNFSRLYSGNEIVVKGNVISSKLISGDTSLALKTPATEVQRIIWEIEDLISNIKNFSQNEFEFYNISTFPNTVFYLLNTKNRKLSTTIYDVIRNLRKGSYDIDDISIYKLVEKCKCFLGNYNEITDLDYIYGVIESIKNTYFIKGERKISGNISLTGALNSEIQSYGNVIISGKTCFNTKIFAGGKVSILGNLRGGRVESEKSVEINNVGTSMGAKTFIRVPDKGFIKMRIVYPDTTIMIGRHSYKFINYQTNIYARVIKNKLIFK
ncbi:hypothetical protein B9R14_04495 [Acetivibrio saccincola]|uniref:Flagellar Assembly Protein A N-terminal region domain-containing protein n=1 Tax=Acetivibrio saccincola TaxID=1677857 RepID=A0A2S8R8H8_9FIRM|nr:hypothetical protein B9R14_04495 [Acetivibrio saccincola]